MNIFQVNLIYRRKRMWHFLRQKYICICLKYNNHVLWCTFAAKWRAVSHADKVCKLISVPTSVTKNRTVAAESASAARCRACRPMLSRRLTSAFYTTYYYYALLWRLREPDKEKGNWERVCRQGYEWFAYKTE